MFARAPIKKGQFVSGRRIRTETADEVGTKYLFELNTRWTIDGSTRRNIARYINHACRPNTETYVVGHVIKVRAIKSIKAGDEITYHYRRNYFVAFIKDKGCKCGHCAKRTRPDARKRRAVRRKR